MTQINFQGEHLLYGTLGHILVIMAFCFALLSSVSYYWAGKSEVEDKAWKLTGRISFFIHALSILGIAAIMFFLIYSHYFEYHYVWHHSSTILPFKYMLACFWEGQEGSFLLWAFWHVILSFFLIRFSGKWEAPVMAIVCMVQVFIASMLLGVFIGDYKLGSDPFILLRNHPDMMNLPFIQMPDYLSKIADGRGLNPLLQNYWMVIHPPILFLGFASTLIPFAYAMAGLMKKQYTEWLKQAIPWTFFGVMILGTGILMGAAWAYESLSFGGFWAWDPVENASLVPWLTLVGAAHAMLIYKNKNQSLFTVIILCLATFLLILYSTFLTRSGILGDTSVHAFTDLGMSGQLLVYMAFFMVWAITLLIIRRKDIPGQSKEESIYSREFWMYIGVIVLVISAFQIIFTTSIPVINKIFSTHLAPPVKPANHYNAWQLPMAVILSILIACVQYLKYKETSAKVFLGKITSSFVISILLTALAAYMLHLDKFPYILLLFSSTFAVIANIGFLIRILKGKLDHAGASIAHIGFGLILLGVLISNAKSNIISSNRSGISMGKDFPNNENILLNKNDTTLMGDYYITYTGKEKKGVNVYFNIDYLKPNEKGKLIKEFTLKPIVQTNKAMGNVSEPDTRHYLTKDIYTHITYADLEDINSDEQSNSEYAKEVTKSVSIGDTASTSNSLIIIKSLDKSPDISSYHLGNIDLAVGVKLIITDINKKIYNVEPIYLIKDNMSASLEARVEELGLQIKFTKINPETGKIDLSIAEKKSNKREFIIMKAIVFPYINLLWTGCLVMILGSILAIRNRMKKR